MRLRGWIKPDPQGEHEWLWGVDSEEVSIGMWMPVERGHAETEVLAWRRAEWAAKALSVPVQYRELP